MAMRNYILSGLVGFFFGVAWWMFVDGVAAVNPQPGYNAGSFYLYGPGILTTIGFFIMSNLPTSMFEKDNTEEHTWWQKALLVFSVMLMLAGIIEGIWTYIDKKADRVTSLQQWRGVSMIVQGIIITACSFCWNFLYKDEEFL